MLVLAFDTALDKMYVALKNDDKFLAAEIIENKDGKYHSAFLISTIKNILRDNGFKPQDIDLIGTNIGPGSFTGIRACITVARVMAQTLNCRAIGVSSLEILAKLADTNPLVALDARKHCAYLYKDNEIKGAVDIDEIKESIKDKDYNIITDNKMNEIFGGTSYQGNEYNLGKILTDLAIEKAASSECNWRKLKPLYIQPPAMG
ncbi:MAG: tRNA (adenosine(37)-N6)-threonylcarbamoyltransferase complex dimerization subunit type 1 TsaB [Clostridiaceae bacterium]|jgi:tRNA threonylcarbamoyl adenosine modification protein YeaZ|nr:tRNA (adenosine(37)-N6)-threonylcarbamoyltransferase complex dimerization subunit type 1 TsaB [Clostridiaceae bacterium]